MKGLKKYLFKLFLVALLVMPVMVKANPVNVAKNTSSEVVLLDEKNELTKEDYENNNKRLCTICIILDIIILICIAALVVRLIMLKREKENLEKKDDE